MNFSYDTYINEEKKVIVLVCTDVEECLYSMIERARLITNKKELENPLYAYTYQWVHNWVANNGYTTVCGRAKCSDEDEMSIPFGTKLALKRLDEKMAKIAAKMFDDIAYELTTAASIFSTKAEYRYNCSYNAKVAADKMIEEEYGEV